MVGELRYNTRSPAGCVAGDSISTYLIVHLCAGRGEAVPEDQKFVFREVRRFVWLLNPVFQWQDLRDYLETHFTFFFFKFQGFSDISAVQKRCIQLGSLILCIFRMERCTTL